MLNHLAEVSIRSLLLAFPATTVLWILRRRCAAALQHAVWTAVVCGMLALFVLGQALPRLPLRVLGTPATSTPATTAVALVDSPMPTPEIQGPLAPISAKASHPVPWRDAAAYAYGAIVFALLAQFATGMFLVRKLLAAARPISFDGADRVYESQLISVPVTVGWLRPRILLPPVWREWDRDKLDAVLTHEGAHVRRRDGLVSALAHVNRCIFWFHPLAWMLERKLALLAEQACDEYSVAALGHRDRYAHLLLEMATVVDGSHGRLRNHALTMAASSHIRQRIESLLQERRTFSRGLTWTGWTAVVLCGVPILLGAGAVELARQPLLLQLEMPRLKVPIPPVLIAQASSAPSELSAVHPAQRPLAFDVVSVRPVLDEGSEVRPKRSGGRIVWTTDLWHLISYAYHLEFRNISGSVPANAPNYHIEATFDPAATEDQVRLMVVTLLRNRFGMEAHRVTKEVDGYGLFVGKNGLRVKEVTTGSQRAGSAATPEPVGWVSALLAAAGVGEIQARGGSISQLVEASQRAQSQMVWDRTGLRGIYDFDFRYAMDASPDIAAPTLETALRETLGLELKKQKGPVETLVVDSIEKEPTDN